jgi:hypothetical protein
MISDADMNRRRLLAAAVLGAGGLALESAAARAEGPAPASPGTGSGFPRQAWATKDHRIAVKAPSETSRGGTAKDILLIHEQFGRFGMAHDELQFDVLHHCSRPMRHLNCCVAQASLLLSIMAPTLSYEISNMF